MMTTVEVLQNDRVLTAGLDCCPPVLPLTAGTPGRFARECAHPIALDRGYY